MSAKEVLLVRTFRTSGLLLLAILLSALSLAFQDEHSLQNSLGMTLIRVSPGVFQMGEDSPYSDWDETPVHEVNIARPFYISESETTIDQYRQFRPEHRGNEKHAPFASGISCSGMTMAPSIFSGEILGLREPFLSSGSLPTAAAPPGARFGFPTSWSHRADGWLNRSTPPFAIIKERSTWRVMPRKVKR